MNSVLASGSLQLTLFGGSAEQPVPLLIGSPSPAEVEFPAVLRVLAPAGHSSSEVSRLTASTLADPDHVQSGTTALSWPAGSHIAQALTLAPPPKLPALPPAPLPPWQYQLVTQDFSATPLARFTSARLAGDDKDALIALRLGVPQLSTLKSSGNGQWNEIASATVQGVPSALLAADLTADGNPELIAVFQSSGKVQLFPGLSGGRLGPPQALLQRADMELLGPVLTDVNGDGLLDLLLANRGTRSSSAVVQLLGQNGASLPFANAAFSNSGGMGPIALTRAVYGTMESPKQLAVLHAEGSRAAVLWSSLTSITAAPTADAQPVAMASGDLDNDGQQDLAIVYQRGTQNGLLRLMRGQTSGGFTLLRELEVPPSPRGLWAADLARDGAADLVLVCDATPTRLYIVPGTTTSDGALFPVEIGGTIDDLVVLDVNGDQWRDLAVLVHSPTRITSLLGRPM